MKIRLFWLFLLIKSAKKYATLYDMQTILLVKNPVFGVFCLVFLFLFCFFAVHLLIVVKRGLKPAPPPPPPEKPKDPKPPEPVYYIVEKKKRPPKSGYGEPKEFRFR